VISLRRNSTNTLAVTDFAVSMKRMSPRALTAEIMFQRYRAPVIRTTGVCPTGAQVVPRG
jgi:hypothetical protein